jgi:endogenous inhibitor of DNA gyrase (YacG/DUF329 family)
MAICPTCRAPAARHGNAQHPFCSLSCRLIDLGVWLDERYRIPAETAAASRSGVSVDDDVS